MLSPRAWIDNASEDRMDRGGDRVKAKGPFGGGKGGAPGDQPAQAAAEVGMPRREAEGPETRIVREKQVGVVEVGDVPREIVRAACPTPRRPPPSRNLGLPLRGPLAELLLTVAARCLPLGVGLLRASPRATSARLSLPTEHRQ